MAYRSGIGTVDSHVETTVIIDVTVEAASIDDATTIVLRVNGRDLRRLRLHEAKRLGIIKDY